MQMFIAIVKNIRFGLSKFYHKQKLLQTLVHTSVSFVRIATELSINERFTVMHLGCKIVICTICKDTFLSKSC